ncbi:MAG: molybdenum cofactor guanylyltransferase [Gallionella sp.]
MIPNCTGLILAGGESRRMGQNKANLLLGEKTLLHHVIATLNPLFCVLIISVRQPETDGDFIQVIDDPSHAGPLAGLAAGLGRAKTPWVFAAACDMPFMTAQLITSLAKYRIEVDAVVPVINGYPQPLAAFYKTTSLVQLRDCLHDNGKQSLRAFLDKLNVRYVYEREIQAADLHSFFDLDTPHDLALAINMKDTP